MKSIQLPSLLSPGRFRSLPRLVGRTVSLLASLFLAAEAAAVEFLVPANPGDTLFYNPDLVIKRYPGADKYRWIFTRADGSGLGDVVAGVRTDKDTPLQNTRINVRVEPLDSRGRVIRAGVSDTWFRTCSTKVELAAPENGQHVGSPVTFSFYPLPRETSVYGYYLFVKSPGAAEPRRFDLSVNATAYLSTLAPGEHEWWLQARTKFENDPESAHWIARVSSLPVFIEHPEGGEFCASEAVALRAEASAVPSFNYHWRRDGVDIPGATAPEFTVPPGEQGVYVCVAFNAAGAVLSEPAVVTRVALPPVSVAASAYDYAAGELRITATGAAEEYEWLLDGEPLEDSGPELILTEVPDAPFTIRAVAVHECGSVESAPLVLAPPAPLTVTRKSPAQIVRLGEAVELVLETSRTAETEWQAPDGGSEEGSPLRVTIAGEEQAGTYEVVASDGFGKVEQAVEVLAVVAEPADQEAEEGESVTLTAEVAGGTPTVQWFKDGAALAGKTELDLDLGKVVAANAGSYHFELKHLDSPTFRSRTTTLKVVAALTVTRKSPAQIVRLGEAVDLLFETSRKASVEWQTPDGTSKEGSPWRVTIAKEEQAGTYEVAASDKFGEVGDSIEVLAVVAEPADQQADEGESVTLTAEVAGGTPTIQWFKDGAALAGKTKLDLDLGKVTMAAAGGYHFELKHLDSPTFRSRTATLKVVAAPVVEPSIKAIRVKADGTVELTITKGSADLALERSTDLDTWEQVAVLTQTGTFTYEDEAQEDEAGVFYRLAEPTDEPTGPGFSDEPKECVRATLAAHLRVDPDNLSLVFDQAVTWPNACLGCLPGACAQMLTPGRRLVFATGGGPGISPRVHEVRTSATGTVALVIGNTGVRLDSCN
jgi:hypothetical protein